MPLSAILCLILLTLIVGVFSPWEISPCVSSLTLNTLDHACFQHKHSVSVSLYFCYFSKLHWRVHDIVISPYANCTLKAESAIYFVCELWIFMGVFTCIWPSRRAARVESESEKWATLLLFPGSCQSEAGAVYLQGACLSSPRGTGWRVAEVPTDTSTEVARPLGVLERTFSIDLLCVFSQHRIWGCLFKVCHPIFLQIGERQHHTLAFIFVCTVSVHLGSGV